MKKAINILSFSSIAVIFLLMFLDGVWGNKDQRMNFILWSQLVLLPFAIPIMFGWFSLAVNKEKIKPKIWLIIYGCALAGYITIIVNFGFIDMTKDLPLAIREDFSQVSGVAQVIEETGSAQTIEVSGITLDLPKNTCHKISANEEYIITYLPNSMCIIEIIGEEGKSFMKK